MSYFTESEPCAAQARMMKRLGWTLTETDDSLSAAWRLGIMGSIYLPAAWAPADEAELMRRLAQEIYQQGIRAARAQMRQALGMS